MGFFSGFLRHASKPIEINLTDIRIASPCPAEWSKMTGDDRVRHCAECHLNVYNLSAMTEREVKNLLAANQGQRLCTRFYRRADGTVLTQDCPWSRASCGQENLAAGHSSLDSRIEHQLCRCQK